MSEPTENSAAPGLVEPQGVNSAPASAGDDPQPEDVRSGGHPDEAAQMDAMSERDEIVGPPDQQAPGPGHELEVGEG